MLCCRAILPDISNTLYAATLPDQNDVASLTYGHLLNEKYTDLHLVSTKSGEDQTPTYALFVADFLEVVGLFDGEAFDLLSDDEPVEEASDFSARSFSAAALYSLLR